MGRQIRSRLTCSPILLILFSLVIIPIKLHAVHAKTSMYTSSNSSSTTWAIVTVDGSESFGAFSSRAIAIDSSNNPHIAYGGNYLYYARYNGSNWSSEIVDSSSGVNDYAFASIALDTSGNAHISYYDADNNNLKYATNTSGGWVTTTVDSSGSGSVGLYTSIALDASGNVHISYLDYMNYDLKYATNASGEWVTTTVDSSGYVGYYTSIALDASGNAHISYFDYTNKDLKYATNASGGWVTTTVDSDGDVGYYTTSIALDASGNAHISYYATSNGDLKYATGSIPLECDGKAKTVETDTGDFELLKGESKVVAVTVTDAGGCPVADEDVSAKVNKAGKNRIEVSSESAKKTDENGEADFTITAKENTGKAKVTFKSGGKKKKITVNVKE